jgi:hypothetical protein
MWHIAMPVEEPSTASTADMAGTGTSFPRGVIERHSRLGPLHIAAVSKKPKLPHFDD